MVRYFFIFRIEWGFFAVFLFFFYILSQVIFARLKVCSECGTSFLDYEHYMKAFPDTSNGIVKGNS